MYLLSKKPRITQKVVKLISIDPQKKYLKNQDDRKTVINMNKYYISRDMVSIITGVIYINSLGLFLFCPSSAFFRIIYNDISL